MSSEAARTLYSANTYQMTAEDALRQVLTASLPASILTIFPFQHQTDWAREDRRGQDPTVQEQKCHQLISVLSASLTN